jgi:hypothetical protein
MDAIQTEFNNQAAAEQKLFDNKIKGLDSDAVAGVVDSFNKMSMNKIVDGKVVTPFAENYPNKAEVKSNQDKLFSLVDKYGIGDAIANDNVGPTKKYGTIKELIEAYYYSDAINRNALMNMYEGPMIHRKNVADVVKRGSGINSGGKLIELDKPVKIYVIDVPSAVVPGEQTADSFSFNGSHLQSRIAKQSGVLDKVGSNVKDQVFQVNPNNGNMLFMKMSSMGISGTIGENNFTEMSDKNADGIGYDRIGDAILKLEEHLGNDPYVKIVDKNVMKGNEGNFTPINVNDFVQAIENDNFDKLEKSGFEQELHSYRVAFNLNKDLSKVPLSEQSVILSTQLAKIALNDGTQQDLNEFEGNIVNLLKTNLKLADRESYSSGKIYKALQDQTMLLRGLTANMDEQEANTIVNIFKSIQDYNEANPSDMVTVFDHPNLSNIVQQFIASKLTKTGIRSDIPGAYLHMLPNYGNDLKWYDEQGGVPEVAVPWSMFGNSKEQAENLLKNTEGGLKTVVVRVPASGPMSTFVGKVKYFTDGKANTAIVPDQFIKASDADHDADKVFVYRQDITDGGMINDISE